MKNRILRFSSSAMISYNITIGDTLTKVFQRIPGGAVWTIIPLAPDTEILHQHVWEPLNPRAAVGPGHILAERHAVIVLSTAVFTLPLSLYRNIGRLGKVCPICCMQLSVLLCIRACLQVSLLSMVLTLAILIIVIIRAATLGPQMWEPTVFDLNAHVKT